MSKEQLAVISVQRFAAFDKIIAVFMRTLKYRQMVLSDLEWFVVPAAASGQFSTAEIQDKASGLTVPVSAVLWATVSDAVDQRLASNAGQPLHRKAQEWTSGSTPWLIAIAGEPRGAAGLVNAVVKKRVCGVWHQDHCAGS